MVLYKRSADYAGAGWCQYPQVILLDLGMRLPSEEVIKTRVVGCGTLLAKKENAILRGLGIKQPGKKNHYRTTILLLPTNKNAHILDVPAGPRARFWGDTDSHQSKLGSGLGLFVYHKTRSPAVPR